MTTTDARAPKTRSLKSKSRNSIDWSPLVELVRQHQRFLLTSHVRPDCDALGSELGMAGVLRDLGKEVIIVNADPIPPNLQFIDPRGEIKVLDRDVPRTELESIDVLIVLDTSAWIQLGGMADVLRSSQAIKAVIDHHVSEDDLNAVQFKNVEAEATGRLVVEAAERLGVPLNPQIAVPLFAAIATDTGWFRFSSTTGQTYRMAGDLADAGVEPSRLFNALYEQYSLARLHLSGRVLARAKTELGGRLIHIHAAREDFAATSALPSDTDEIINMTLQVAGTEVAVFIVELPSGAFKASFRSRSHVDCSRVAETFGGGGHRAAAGATLHGTLESVQRDVLDAVRRAMG